MDILSIGNSFSQDAQRYLHRIAQRDDFTLNSFNLFIGGCSLQQHYRNMCSDEKTYTLEMNGESTDFLVSLKEALTNRPWDVITMQQVSQQSPDYHSFQPYLDELTDYVRRTVPNAKIAIHQTWAYHRDNHVMREHLGFADHHQMLSKVVEAYQEAAEHIGADYLIPSGEVMGALLKSGIQNVHRDMLHASNGLGRFALGLTWYTVLTGRSIENIALCRFDEEITPEEQAIAKACVTRICQKYRKLL